MSRLPVAPCDALYPHLAHDHRAPGGWSRCRGIRIDPASRAHPVSARAHVVAELRAIKSTLQYRISRWAVTGVEWAGTGHNVPRPVDEFPENMHAAWVALASACGEQSKRLAELQAYAVDRARAMEVRERRRRERAVG